jgi:hypothetical protein
VGSSPLPLLAGGTPRAFAEGRGTGEILQTITPDGSRADVVSCLSFFVLLFCFASLVSRHQFRFEHKHLARLPIAIASTPYFTKRHFMNRRHGRARRGHGQSIILNTIDCYIDTNDCLE